MRRVLIRLAPLAVFAVAAFVAPAAAQPAKTAPARATQSPPPAAQPTPYAVNTLPPAAQAPLVPYPAYGSPVPGVTGAAPPSPLPPTVSLDQAEAIGFELSPLLTQARGDVGVQAALVRIDAAGLLPNLQGTASTSRTHNQRGSLGSTGGGSTTRAGIGDFTANSVGADISQLIYDGGRVAAGVKAAQHSETSSADTYRRELQTVANNVAQAYYAYLATERAVQAALEIVREDVVQEDLVRAQVRAGTAARSDIATAQLPTAQARLAVVRAQGAEFAAQAAFANAMGLDAGYNLQPIDDAPVFTNAPVQTIPVPTYQVAITRALALRPDYDSAVQSMLSAEYSLKAARLGLFPTISGSGSAQTASTDPGGGSFRNTSNVGASIVIPLFDQGLTAARSAEARSQLVIANGFLQNTKIGVQLSVKQALTNLVSASAAFDQTQVEYSTAVTVLQATQAQYRAGVTTLPLLLNAQVGITTALVDQVTAVYSLREAEQSYLYAVGSNYDVTKMKI